MQAPCKDCQDRHYLCHSTCEKYIAYDKFRKDLLAKKSKIQSAEEDWFGSRRRLNRKKR